jgi:hypothetical protein
MDPDVMRLLASRSFGQGVVPTVFALGLLVHLWWIGELYGVSARVFCSWFLIALAAQVVGLFRIATAGPITLWVLGLAAQSLLAIVLVLKKQLTND